MKNILFGILLLASYLSIAQEKTIVVAELFTSEGCSSCPPADKLLSELVDSQDLNVEILALSFHVDYWDYIGWKDPYATKTNTNRQRAYARKFYANQVYTPQLVVNGKHEFVGSSKSKWNDVLKKEKQKKRVEELTFKDVSIESDEVSFELEQDLPPNTILNIAVVERNLSQNVKNGENRGRLLSHDNVVRAYDSFTSPQSIWELKFSDDIDIDNSSLIVFLQQESNWEVTAASQILLKNYM